MKTLKAVPINYYEIVRARSVVGEFLKPTNFTYYEGLSKALNLRAYVKHENHNPTGSFKIRGGINLLHHLRRVGAPGVVTFSTGNHGLSIATASKLHGLPAIVVVPINSNPTKIKAIRECGAELIEAGNTFEEASLKVEEICDASGYYYAHPGNEPLLINGVASEFMEIVEEHPDLDVMIVPLGAGSEAAAAITTLRYFNPNVKIVAVQAERSQAAFLSWKNKEIVEASNRTFAGGFATGIGYERPFEIYRDGLDDVVLLDEEEIYDGIGVAWHYTHNLVEGAGSAAIMAAYKLRNQLAGLKVGLQMSGCNASVDEIRTALKRNTVSDGFAK